MDSFAANLKEFNDLIDNDIEYRKEIEDAERLTNTCVECKHAAMWHMNEGCTYKAKDGFACDCDETEIEFK